MIRKQEITNMIEEKGGKDLILAENSQKVFQKNSDLRKVLKMHMSLQVDSVIYYRDLQLLI